MIVVLMIMLTSMVLSWSSFCLTDHEGADVKAALASIRTQVLAGGVVVFVALMPFVVCGTRACGADHSLMLALVYCLAATVCIVMLVTKTRRQARVWDVWKARMWATVVRSEMV